MIIKRPGVGYPWAIFRPEIAAYPVWLHKQTRKYIRVAMQQLGARRMEVHIEENSPRNREWAERLGFRLAQPVERIRDHRNRIYIKYST